jgi:hypothetical protein
MHSWQALDYSSKLHGMPMNTAELTIHLPTEEASFLERYAQQHQTTVDELIASYAKRLKGAPESFLHPDIVKITGLVPADWDARSTYHQHILKKHQ